MKAQAGNIVKNFPQILQLKIINNRAEKKVFKNTILRALGHGCQNNYQLKVFQPKKICKIYNNLNKKTYILQES